MKTKHTFKEFQFIPGDSGHVQSEDYEFWFHAYSLCKVIILEYGQVDLESDDKLPF